MTTVRSPGRGRADRGVGQGRSDNWLAWMCHSPPLCFNLAPRKAASVLAIAKTAVPRLAAWRVLRCEGKVTSGSLRAQTAWAP